MRTGHRALSDEDDKRAESKCHRPIRVLPSAVPPRAVWADAIPPLETIIHDGRVLSPTDVHWRTHACVAGAWAIRGAVAVGAHTNRAALRVDVRACRDGDLHQGAVVETRQQRVRVELCEHDGAVGREGTRSDRWECSGDAGMTYGHS